MKYSANIQNKFIKSKYFPIKKITNIYKIHIIFINYKKKKINQNLKVIIINMNPHKHKEQVRFTILEVSYDE